MESKIRVVVILTVVFLLGTFTGYFMALTRSSQLHTYEVPEVKVSLLPNKKYYSRITDLVRRANRSIYTVMFVVKYDPKEPDDPVNVILGLLCDAKRRGLDIRVLVDDETKRSYKKTLEYLAGCGIPVRLDKGRRVTTHVKMLLIDGKYLVVGSHNWTESALKYNNEFSVLIVSEKLYRKALSYFNELWVSGRAINS